MTESIIPDDQANGMVDGTLSASEVPASMRGAAEVLAAAHQPADAEELTGMSAMVASFTAAVMAPVVETPEPVRSTSRMITSRITTRAAIMASVGLLVAGTAAAAAGGAIPSPFHAVHADVELGAADDTSTTAAGGTTTTAVGDTTTTTAAGDTTTTAAGDTTTTAEGDTTTTAAGDTTTTVLGAIPTDGRHHGLCEAWTHGAHKKSNPAFSSLESDATAAGTTVDQFCHDVITQWHQQHGQDGDASTTSTVAGATTTTDASKPQHPQGPPTSVDHPHGPPTSVDHPHGPPTSVPPVTLPSQTGGHGSGHGGTTTTMG